MLLIQLAILVGVIWYLRRVPYQGATQDLNHFMSAEAPIDFYLRFYS